MCVTGSAVPKVGGAEFHRLHAAVSQAPRPLDNPPEVATMLLLLESFCDYAEVAAAELPSYLRTVMPSHRVR